MGAYMKTPKEILKDLLIEVEAKNFEVFIKKTDIKINIYVQQFLYEIYMWSYKEKTYVGPTFKNYGTPTPRKFTTKKGKEFLAWCEEIRRIANEK